MNRADNPQNNPVLKVENLSKSFGKVEALRNVSLEIFQGDVVGLVGDNGAGKSTLIKIISGNFRADEGDVYLNG
ncbi:MAG: ATP-binding cassette domain-containing protein, partial [Spirochaetes bacterium]|nr:ATP-binding cassette domain-containing protein [Spirochaetota bacterium]